jgi:hypothetical protein
MNPIQTSIFLLSIAIIIFMWISVFAEIDKTSKLGRGFKLFCGVLATLEISLAIYLSVYIPYSIYWLMSIWNW